MGPCPYARWNLIFKGHFLQRTRYYYSSWIANNLRFTIQSSYLVWSLCRMRLQVWNLKVIYWFRTDHCKLNKIKIQKKSQFGRNYLLDLSALVGLLSLTQGIREIYLPKTEYYLFGMRFKVWKSIYINVSKITRIIDKNIEYSEVIITILGIVFTKFNSVYFVYKYLPTENWSQNTFKL